MGHEIIIRIGCHRYCRFIKEIVKWKWISLMIPVNEVYFATVLCESNLNFVQGWSHKTLHACT